MMTTPEVEKAAPLEKKPGKNEFKCFHCRNIFSNKEGDWFAWNQMEVHLCKVCDKATQKRSERLSS